MVGCDPGQADRDVRGNIANCPDPAHHPHGPLPVVVERVLRSSVPPGEAPALTCRVCGSQDDTRIWHDDSRWLHLLCRTCGITLAVQRAEARDPLSAAERTREWKEIWSLRNDSTRREPS